MAYFYNGYGTFGTSSGTNVSSLNLVPEITNIATSAFNGNLKGFDSAYYRGSGTRSDPGGGCTWWASGRAAMAYGNNWSDGGNAGSWFSRLGGVTVNSWSDISNGDILCFDGHVAFVESIGANTIFVSEGASGSNNWNIIIIASHDKSWFGNGSYSGSHWYWGETFYGVLKGNGSGGGVIPTPVQPDTPPPTGYGKFRLTIKKGEMTTITIPYTDIYECGTGTFGDQSGDQDAPKAPEVISTSTSRENQRWEPFNMYTYERALTYASNKNPIWSNWELKYQGSDNFPLGAQPQYGVGWEVNWN